MITPTMNKVEINRQMWQVADNNPLVLACIQKFKKECRKLPRGRVLISKRFFHKESNQHYVLSMFQNLGLSSIVLSAEVDHGSQLWYYKLNEDLRDTTDSFSTHFLKRFAERTGRKFSMPETLAQFFLENLNMVKIYESPDELQLAYASRIGIMLCRSEKELGITRYCTFVSREMLKESQEMALQTILGEIDRIEDIYKDGPLINKMKPEDLLKRLETNSNWSNSITTSEAACAIYAQFFEEGQ